MAPHWLLSSLEQSNDYFDSLVEMIPSNFYKQPNDQRFEEDEMITTKTSKYFKGTNKESLVAKKGRHKASKASMEESVTTSRVRSRQEDVEESVDIGKINSPHKKLKTNDSKEIRGSRIEALRTRLQEKIAERQKTSPLPKEGIISKRAARRSEKIKRIEMAKARRAAGGQQSAQQNSNKEKKNLNAVTGTKSQALEVPADDIKIPPKEDLDTVDFNKLAGLSKPAPAYKNNKSLANIGKKKSLDRLLAEAEQKQKRLKELKEGDTSDQAEAAKILWNDAIKEATGERLNDNPAAIRKKLKRKQKQKEKSVKNWASRVEKVEEAKNERQKIRNHNLEKRKLGGTIAANLSKKKIVDAEADEEGNEPRKKGRMGPYAGNGRAGFEGRKREYLNGKEDTAKNVIPNNKAKSKTQ